MHPGEKRIEDRHGAPERGALARLTPQAFAEKWSGADLSERAGYQEHFRDLCAMLGQPTPSEADPAGSFYAFEKGVEKTGGGKGFADVWYENRFAFEYKGRHKDLGAAYQQLLQYREPLGNPPLLVVTDMDRYEVHTNFTGTVKRVYRFTNAELPRPENLRVLRDLFTDPGSLRPERTAEGVTEEAARRFAVLADGLRGRGVGAREAAHFLNQLLFCLFAEDVGLLPRSLFTRMVERSVRDPERFVRQAAQLFETMRSGGEFGVEDIPRFNGGLYAEDEAGDGAVVPLTREELRMLAEAARLDWGSVEPAIFGTLFERSLDPAQRARLGAHYTSREDILAVIEPVLMAPLRREWGAVRERAAAEAEKARDLSGTKATNALRRAEALLYGFAERLRGVRRVLDLACGSGNFLYVSLGELLDLEKEVSAFAGTVGLTPFFPGVGPEQLRGIETSPYAHELAQVVVWIGYLQWMHDNGYGTREEPILGPMTNIVEMDAILAHDENGDPREPEWPEADVILGNPPFLGSRKMRSTLGDEYCDALQEVYKGRIDGLPDLVCYWFECARRLIGKGKAKRAGLLATNSIRGGANRKVLQNVKKTGDIFMAWSDRPWILNGASVRVSIVGFDDGTEQQKVLDGAVVADINPDLTGTANLSSAVVLTENKGIAFQGVVLRGPFHLSREEAQEMLVQRGNPNGRPNSDVIRPRINGMDITRRSKDSYVVDFGVNTPLEEAAFYEAPFEHVKMHVYPMRQKAKQASAREKWWLHWNPRPRMKHLLADLDRFVVTPTVSKHRLFVWLEKGTLPDHQLIVFARDDDYFFGVLHSRAHELWALRMGTSLEDRPRYTPTTCFETFPFPEPSEEQRAEVSAAARRLDELRRNWLDPEGATVAELKKRTLTNLYNQRPTWLANAHARLDAAVYDAYGWSESPDELNEEELLRRLLDLNTRRAEASNRLT